MTVLTPRGQTRPRIARDKYALSPRTASDRVRSPPWHPQTVATSRPGEHGSNSLIEGPLHTRELPPLPAVLAGHVTATRRRWRGLTVVDRREDVRIANDRGLAEEVFHVKHRRVRASVTPVRGAMYATPSASGVPLMCRRARMGVHAAPNGVRAVRVRHISWTFPRCGGCSSSVSATSYAVRRAPLPRTSTSPREHWVFHVKHRCGRCIHDLRSPGVVRRLMNGRDPVPVGGGRQLRFIQ